MFKFTSLGAKAKVLAIVGFVVLAGLLTTAVPNRAEAGINGNLIARNVSGHNVYVYVGHVGSNGSVQWDNPVLVNNGDTLTWHIGDDLNGTTQLYGLAADGSGLKWFGPSLSNAISDYTWTLNP